MNGAVAIGVALVVAALFFSGWGLIPMLMIGVGVIAYGAFAPAKLPPASGRRATEDDPFV
jgi:hypothetical protein